MVLGVFDIDFLRELIASPDTTLVIDILNGVLIEGSASPELKMQISGCPNAVKEMCASEHIMIYDYRKIQAKFWLRRSQIRLDLTIEDRRRKKTTAEYCGTPLKRVRQLDEHGRIRSKPIQRD